MIIVILEFLEVIRPEDELEHLEIETYTFDVLPEELRAQDVAASIAREYEWLLPRLGNATAEN